MNNEKTILCIGAGYVGGPTMAMIELRYICVSPVPICWALGAPHFGRFG